MKEIICTNCGHSLSVMDEHYSSSKMEFSCDKCSSSIRKDIETDQWIAHEAARLEESIEEEKATPKFCKSCQVEMVRGHIPDDSYRNRGREIIKPYWYEGDLQHETFLGFELERYKRGHGGKAVTAYRCPKCGIVDLYTEI